MAHARETIRARVATMLTGLTTTAARVFQSRVYNVQESELPCLLIYTVSEDVAEVTLGDPRTLERVLTLVVEGKAQATADLDDTLDDIGQEVETALGGDPDLSIGVYDTLLETVEIDYSADGDVPVGSIVMRFLVTYRTAENAPGVIV